MAVSLGRDERGSRGVPMDKRILRRGAAFLAAVALIGIAGWLARGTPREGSGNLVAYGPFLIPRATIIPGLVPTASGHASAGSSLSGRLSLSVLAGLWEKPALAFLKLDITGAETITTIAGTGTFGFTGDGGPATRAQLRNPSRLALDGSGNLFVADASNHLAVGDVWPWGASVGDVGDVGRL